MALKLQLSGPDTDRDEEKKAELTEHLAELRTRLIRACLYVAVGMVVMYVFSKPLFSNACRPRSPKRWRRCTKQCLGLPESAADLSFNTSPTFSS